MKITLSTVILSVCLSTTLTTNLQAQTKRTQPTSKPVTTQTATTDDGRKVILKSNKTWEYTAEDSTVTETKVATQPQGKASSVLAIETGLVFKSGDVKPLARTEFHILDDSLANILRNAGLKPPKSYGETGEADRDYISAFAFASKYSSNQTYQEFYPRAIEALKPHIVQSVTTDFSGKAKFAPVPAGTYYIMGLGSTPRGFVIWNLKTDLKAGENPVVLDQNNADIAL